MDWNVNDKFKISGIINLDTHCPRVKTTGVITELIGTKKARAVLKTVENESNVEAVVKLRDIRPIE